MPENGTITIKRAAKQQPLTSHAAQTMHMEGKCMHAAAHHPASQLTQFLGPPPPPDQARSSMIAAPGKLYDNLKRSLAVASSPDTQQR